MIMIILYMSVVIVEKSGILKMEHQKIIVIIIALNVEQK